MSCKSLVKNDNDLKRKLKKKRGDDKLVISLVLIAVGVILCFVYRDKISTSIGSAIESLDTKISEVFGDAKTNSGSSGDTGK